MTTKTCAFAIAFVLAGRAYAQSSSWTSNDIGAVALAGGATENSGVWTITGDGSDVWGTTDSFQFLHQKTGESGAVTMRVADLQNTSPFAKAGLMARAGSGADAATVIFDVKPDGGLEFMARRCAGCAMKFIAGAQAKLPLALGLFRNADGTFSAGASGPTGNPASRVDSGTISVPMTNPLSGFAVTSHDTSHTATATFSHPIH